MSVAIWRASELAFLREQWASEAVRTLLGSTNRYRVAASHVRKAFLQKFGEQPYPAEMDDEYQARLALCKTNRSRKKTPWFEAETEEQCRERLSSLDQRIYDWGRNHATSRSVKRLNVAMPRAAQIACSACSGNDPRACRPWDVFRELLKQGNYTRPNSPPPPAGGKAWTEWASALYETLTEEEKAKLQELVQKRHHEMMHTPAEMEAKLGAEEYERSRRVAGMETVIRLTTEHWEKQTGWVGTIMMTGLDENGYVTMYTHNTGSNHANQDFEQTLHEEAGLSLGCIRGTLFRFGQDIFDHVPAAGIETSSLPLTDSGVTALMEEEVDRRSLLSTSSPVPSPAALGTETPEIHAAPPPTVRGAEGLPSRTGAAWRGSRPDLQEVGGPYKYEPPGSDGPRLEYDKPPEAACGPKGNTMPKAHPVAITTATEPSRARTRTSPYRQQAPLLRNATQREECAEASESPAEVEQWRRHYKNAPLPSAAPTADNQHPAALTGNHHPPKVTQAASAPAPATQHHGRTGPATPKRQRRPSTSQGPRPQARTPTLTGRRSNSKNDNRRRYRYRHRDRPRRAYTDTTSKEARC
ncbi:hypothetical protein WOLCODRAFT_149479 [Wolfiporia cocos MD-104 SS10]|uniref:Uncharacterized protein n=1 Tax=Wolfiporia cocos (strain MD-104) TaxID=742152 RepID=A0A2H3JFG2_WOLCO|nr:hypothetical protein WOLCODRAFT_149479 [Wolfiporia cocos MD-104 SS10]